MKATELRVNSTVADTAFPRLAIIESLILALQRYPTLARPATDALVDLGSAIAANTTQAELDALLNGLLVDEAPVRHACLQALTVGCDSPSLARLICDAPVIATGLDGVGLFQSALGRCTRCRRTE